MRPRIVLLAASLLAIALLTPSAPAASSPATRTVATQSDRGARATRIDDVLSEQPLDAPGARPRGTGVVWQRHQTVALYSSTGIAGPSGLGIAGTTVNAPRQAEAVPLAGDGTEAWTSPGTHVYVAASRDGNVIAMVDYRGTDSSAVVSQLDVATGIPLWSHTVRPCRSLVYQGWASRKPVQVSDDGSTIAVGISMYGSPANFGRVLLFDAGDSVPDTFDVAGTSITAVEVSKHGEFVAVAAWPSVHVIDHAGSGFRWTAPIGAGNDALAISANGRYLAWGWSTFHLREWNGTTYSPVWTYDRPGTWYVGQCAFSDDDTLLALSWDNGSAEPNRTLVDLHELPSLSLRWEYEYGTTPAVGHVDVPSRMVFEGDGHRFAVASWGGAFPELHVFEEASAPPIFTLDTPGSMFDVDLVGSGNALRLTTCGKAVHAGTGGSGGDFYSIELGGGTDVPQGPALAVATALGPIRPSPFRTRGSIDYTLAAPGVARVSIHDVTGRLVATVRDAPSGAGPHSVGWSGRGSDGGLLPSGVYLVRLEVDGVVRSRKVTVLR